MGSRREPEHRREVLLGAHVRALGMEPMEIIELHRRFYREFYFRPITLARHAENMKSWADVRKYLAASTSSPSCSSTRNGRRSRSSGRCSVQAVWTQRPRK